MISGARVTSSNLKFTIWFHSLFDFLLLKLFQPPLKWDLFFKFRRWLKINSLRWIESDSFWHLMIDSLWWLKCDSLMLLRYDTFKWLNCKLFTWFNISFIRYQDFHINFFRIFRYRLVLGIVDLYNRLNILFCLFSALFSEKYQLS